MVYICLVVEINELYVFLKIHIVKNTNPNNIYNNSTFHGIA